MNKHGGHHENSGRPAGTTRPNGTRLFFTINAATLALLQAQKKEGESINKTAKRLLTYHLNDFNL